MPQTISELKAEIKREIMKEVETAISELTASVSKNFAQIDVNFDTMLGKIQTLHERFNKELSGRRERQP